MFWCSLGHFTHSYNRLNINKLIKRDTKYIITEINEFISKDLPCLLLQNPGSLLQIWFNLSIQKCVGIYANMHMLKVNYTRSVIISIYLAATLVWCLWFHKWNFDYVKNNVDMGHLRSDAEWILSMKGHDAPPKSPKTKLLKTNMYHCCLWFHRVGPQKGSP